MTNVQINRTEEPAVLSLIKDFTNNVNIALEENIINDSTAIIFLDKSLKLKDLYSEYKNDSSMPWTEYEKYVNLSNQIRSFNTFFKKKMSGDSLEGGYIYNGGTRYYCLAEYKDYLLLIRSNDNTPVIAKGYNGINWEHGTYGMPSMSKTDGIDQLSEMIEMFREKSGLEREVRPARQR